MITETEILTNTVVSLAELPQKVEDARSKKGALMVIALILVLVLAFALLRRSHKL